MLNIISAHCVKVLLVTFWTIAKFWNINLDFFSFWLFLPVEINLVAVPVLKHVIKNPLI